MVKQHEMLRNMIVLSVKSLGSSLKEKMWTYFERAFFI